MLPLARQGLRHLRTTSSYAAHKPQLPCAVLRSSKKFISSSSKTRDSTSPQAQALLSDQSPIDADQENEQLTRLERLLKVSERLAKGAGKSTVPLSMKGLGVYSKDGAHTLRKEEHVGDLQPLPKKRRMSDSFCQMELKFSEDEALREEFVGSYSKVRMGALLEKFDWLAGSSAVRRSLVVRRRPENRTQHYSPRNCFATVPTCPSRRRLRCRCFTLWLLPRNRCRRANGRTSPNLQLGRISSRSTTCRSLRFRDRVESRGLRTTLDNHRSSSRISNYPHRSIHYGLSK